MTSIRDQLSQEELNLISKALVRSGLATRVTPIVNGLISEKEIIFGEDDSLTIEFKMSDSIRERDGKESCYSMIMILTYSLEPHLFDVYTAAELFSDSSVLKRHFLTDDRNQALTTSWSQFCGYIREKNPQLLQLMKN